MDNKISRPKKKLIKIIKNLPDYYDKERILMSLIEKDLSERGLLEQMRKEVGYYDQHRASDAYFLKDENSPFDPKTGMFKKECIVAVNVGKEELINFITKLPDDYTLQELISAAARQDLLDNGFQEHEISRYSRRKRKRCIH